MALPIKKLDEALHVRQVKRHWYIGTAVIGKKLNTFFARSPGELWFKYRAAQLQHLEKTLIPTARVLVRPSRGIPVDTRVYQIAMVGAQMDGTPVAWLQGRPGCIPLERLILVDGSDGVAA